MVNAANMPPNIQIAASDNNLHAVLSFLSQDPAAANSRDQNGYTPIHAAASYGHLDLLRLLIREHGGDVNIKDDEGDTPLFTCESVEVARCLVEEFQADWRWKNEEGFQAADVIAEDGQYPLLVSYLRSLETSSTSTSTTERDPGSPPPGIGVDVRAVAEEEVELPPMDEEFRRKIEELAARTGDLNAPAAQEELRSLVTEAVRGGAFDGEVNAERNVRSRQ